MNLWADRSNFSGVFPCLKQRSLRYAPIFLIDHHPFQKSSTFWNIHLLILLGFLATLP